MKSQARNLIDQRIDPKTKNKGQLFLTCGSASNGKPCPKGMAKRRAKVFMHCGAFTSKDQQTKKKAHTNL